MRNRSVIGKIIFIQRKIKLITLFKPNAGMEEVQKSLYLELSSIFAGA